ncbi:MAG: hypothetical protein IIB71_11455, partial [Proteobacteria bacterium]|nr:hypothetical protein [Pseudomonadota bacterium]
MSSGLIQSSNESNSPSVEDSASYPQIQLPDASFLLHGAFEQDGFDLIITNPAGEVFVVHDYFSFDPPPNLVIANGAGMSPEMVRAFMPQKFGDDVQFAGPATSGATAIEIGKVVLAFGDVRVRHADGSVDKLSRGDILYKGDVIITGNRAFVKAQMLDGTRFHLGKNGEAALTDFEYNEAAKIGNFSVTVRVGGFHYKSGKIGKMFEGTSRSHSTIKTPSAIIGIRGSELDGVVDQSGQTIIVHKSGYLVIADINGQNEVVLEAPGNTSVIVLNGIPAFSVQASAQQIQFLNENLPPPDTAADEQAEQTEETVGEEEAATDETDAEGEQELTDDADEETAEGESGEEELDEEDSDDAEDEDAEDDPDATEDDVDEAEDEVEAEVDAEETAEGEGETEADIDAEADAEGDSETEADVEAETETETETEAEEEADTDVETEAEAETEADTDVDAESEAEGDTDTTVDAESDAEAATEPEADADAGSDIEADAETDAGPEADSDADTDGTQEETREEAEDGVTDDATDERLSDEVTDDAAADDVAADEVQDADQQAQSDDVVTEDAVTDDVSGASADDSDQAVDADTSADTAEGTDLVAGDIAVDSDATVDTAELDSQFGDDTTVAADDGTGGVDTPLETADTADATGDEAVQSDAGAADTGTAEAEITDTFTGDSGATATDTTTSDTTEQDTALAGGDGRLTGDATGTISEGDATGVTSTEPADTQTADTTFTSDETYSFDYSLSPTTTPTVYITTDTSATEG